MPGDFVCGAAGAVGEHRAVEPGTAALSLDEAKMWLRVIGAEDDAAIAGLVRSASETCEAFIGQLLIVRACRGVVAGGGEWARLGLTPVRRIDGVASLAADGSESALAGEVWQTEIDAGGDGWVRLRGPGISGAIGGSMPGRIAVSYRAGIAADVNGVPEPLRQGMLRLVAHLYATRGGDAGDAAMTPPAAVGALWRPWRRMRL